MNKHLHRIIFNAARGVRMVVHETATNIGKGVSKGTSKAVGTTTIAASATLFGVLVALPGQAQIVSDPSVPGPLRPTVLVAPNGVPLVNIQTPSTAGVSRNVYQQFDVMRNGAILNNSRVNVQTQLGGFVQGNAWLAKGPARVILNEINSGSPTQLRGYVEVGGQRAEVIVANPVGISVDGGGFINASRATLTTGTPQLNAMGGLDSFLVRGGTVSIDGAGLDAGKTDYAAILARAVQVNAGIWASELKMVAGANQVSADSGQVTPLTATGAVPTYALDVAGLGGMYAQKITLVGTEAGLGVRNAGIVGASAGGLVVTVQGRLENTGTLEGPRVELASSGDIDNRGGTIRQTSMAALTIDSPVLSNTRGGVIGFEPMTATTPAAGTGATGSTGAANFSSGGTENTGTTASYLPLSPGSITAAGTLRNDGGKIYAGGPITLHSANINNNGGTLNLASMAVNQPTFDNHGGTITVSNGFSAKVDRFDNTGGKLNAGTLAIAATGDLLNVGGALTSAADASFTVGGNADNTRGTIAANGALTASVAGATNNGGGALASNQRVALNTGSLDNTKGSILSAQAGVQITAIGMMVNGVGGSIDAATDLKLNAGTLTNNGVLRGENDVDVVVGDVLVNNDSITARRHTTIAAGRVLSSADGVLAAGVQSDGQLGSAGDLRVIATGTLVANGTNLAAGNATLRGASVDLSGKRTSAENIAVTSTRGDVKTSRATIATPGALSILANAQAGQTLVNDGGKLNAARLNLKASNIANTNNGEIVQTGTDASAIATSGALNNDGARIASNGQDLSLRGATVTNAGGRIEHAGSGTLNISGGNYSGTNGQVTATGSLVVGMTGAFNQDGTKSGTSAKRITIEAGSLSNRGGQIVQTGTDAMRITVAGAADNSGGTMAGNGNTTLVAATLDNSSGTVSAVKGNLSATTTGKTTNDAGVLQAGARTTLSVGGLVNRGGKVFGDILSVDAGGNTLDNSLKGTLAATTTLDVTSGLLNNDTGLIQSGGAMTIDTNGKALVNTHAAGYTTQQGGISSADTLALKNVGAVDNTAGFIGAKNALTARTQAFTNTLAGTVLGQSNVEIDTGGARYDNTEGRTQAVNDLRIDAGGLVNTRGLIRSGARTMVNAGSVVNNKTQGESQGIEGKNVVIGAAGLDNTSGAIRAELDARISSGGRVDNTKGLMSVSGTLAVVDPNAANPGAKTLDLVNTGGTLVADKHLLVDGAAFSGDGRAVSAKNLSMALTQDVVNNGEVAANGNLSYTTTGTFTNNGKLMAGQRLTVGGADVDNTANAEMSGTDTVVNASGSLTNRGLIDSKGKTQINAVTLKNIGTGRIYGNAVSVGAVAVENSAETLNGATKAATVAARDTLHIGAQTVGNREGALLFSVGAMSIRGALDSGRLATGTGVTLDNESASIESLGKMTIAMRNINNVDTHLKVATNSSTVLVPSIITMDAKSWSPADTWGEVDTRLVRHRGADGTVSVIGKGWTDAITNTTVTEDAVAVGSAAPARIVAGGNMTLDGHLFNRDSQVMAGGELNAPDVDNQATPGKRETSVSAVWTGYNPNLPGKGPEKPLFIPATRTVETYRLTDYKPLSNLNATQGYNAGAAGSTLVGDAAGGTGKVAFSERQRVIVEVASDVKGVVKARPVSAGAVVEGLETGNAGSRTVPMVVRTSVPDVTVPRASLFGLNTGGRYLIETDPRFANYRQWLSSDYLLANMGVDPNATLKRLGDGFYEQKLIREQVAQLTGYRFLEGQHNDEAQYTALMNSGATFAMQYGLRPGIALTAAQMAQLTSDIVWLVEQTVTLPDGSTQNLLAPQLYVRVRPGDIDGSGALLSADATVIERGGGDLVNTGTIAGRAMVKIDKDNVHNLGGRIVGGDVRVHAAGDIDNIGGSIVAGDSAVLTAGRDINVRTTTQTQGGAQANRTNIDRVAGVYVSNPKGTLAASAGRDVNLVGGIFANAGADSETLLKAKRDINVSTVKEAVHQEQGRGTARFLSQSSSREIGSQIVGDGAVTLDARKDIRIRGSAINAQGDLTLKAREGNVRVEAGRATVALDLASDSKIKGFLSSKTNAQRDSLREDTAVGSALGGHNVGVSGQNVTVSGSEVIADESLAIVAKRDLTIEAARNTRSESSYRGTAKSGLMGSGGVGFTVGSRSESTDTRGESTSAAASTVGSIGGNTTLIAGNQYTQTGSHVVVPEGDVTIAAKSIKIQEARETSRTQTVQKQQSGGLTIALTAPVASAVQGIGNTAKAVQRAGSGRMQALGAASMAAEAKGVADALANANTANLAESMGVNLSISLGGSQNVSKRNETSDSAAGSRVEGKNVNLLALGGGKSSNIVVQGSDIIARDTASLVAENRIDVLAAKNTSERQGANKGSGGSVGVSFGTNGLMFNVSANASQGKSDGTDTSYTNSHVSAGKAANLASGGDMTIRGGVIEADRVTAKVGGDLKIESLQDTSTSTSKQQSVGGSLSVGYGVWSASVNASSAKASGNYASVKEQSGIKAGDGGFDVDVKGAAGLKGAVIESTQAAVDGVKNTFKSASLSTSDIQNVDMHKASGASLGMGASGQQHKGEDKQPIAGSDFKVGTGGGAGAGTASGKQASVTKSGISGIAGDQSVRTGVDSTNALAKKWSTDQLLGEVQAQAQITQTFGPKAAKAVGDYAGTQIDKYERAQLQAQQANKVLNDPGASDGQRAQAAADLANANSTLAAEQQNYDNWKEGGASRVLAHTLVGGLTGNVQGAAGAALASAAAPTIEDLTRNMPEGIKGAVGAGLAAGLGAAGGGMAGAAAGVNEDFNNRQSNAAQREALARLQQSKGEADQKKLADAMCAILKCAAGVDPNSAGYAALVSSQNRGTDYTDEQRSLLTKGVFSEYGLWSDGAIDIASRLLHNARDEVHGAGSGAGYLGNVVANDFRSAVASANQPDIPPDIDSGGKPPAAGGSAVVVGLAPTMWCIPPACIPGLAPVVSGGRLGYAPGNWTLATDGSSERASHVGGQLGGTKKGGEKGEINPSPSSGFSPYLKRSIKSALLNIEGGGGVPRMDEKTGAQTVFDGTRKIGQAQWAGALEYSVPGGTSLERILIKKLPNGEVIRGYSLDHYTTIVKLK
ncbi:hemagglutinin repeat-containing protein [Variovorax sp. J22G73]|uniref:two-partner secretion domain-containing protein n=1 Tax=unclassified Variovorax TaxID=663243 RepID=UPI000D5D19DB|nr:MULTISPECIES: hemagglutinin repeat-containing protein [unclassified Variovorax]MDM0007814.1 hemagglutinin repeat-containing protein [Variovorax sp. J22R203]MDM0100563.1 hemagglutinin repeat-containing protein [Variovorax sp. J22G73]